MADFEWSGSDTIIRTTGAVAAYVNSYGDIVIRQQDPFGGDDGIIIVPVAIAERLIDRLCDLVGVP